MTQHHGNVVVEPVDPVNPGNNKTLEEGYQYDDPTPSVEVKDLEHVHSSLKCTKSYRFLALGSSIQLASERKIALLGLDFDRKELFCTIHS